MLKATGVRRGQAQIDRFYANIRAGRRWIKKQSTPTPGVVDSRRQTILGSTQPQRVLVRPDELVGRVQAAIDLAGVKNEQLRKAADAALMPPPVHGFPHDPFGFDEVDADLPGARLMVSPMSSPKARALKSCVQRVIYTATPSPEAPGRSAQRYKDTPDPRSRAVSLAEREKAGAEFLWNSGVGPRR